MSLLKEIEILSLNGTNEVDGILFSEFKTDLNSSFTSESVDDTNTFELTSLDGANNNDVDNSLRSESQVVASSTSSVFDSFDFISIPTSGSASPYPSTIFVSGMTGGITKVTVTLFGINHTFPDDIDVLLVGPSGQRTLLMSDVGGTNDLNGVNLTFDSTVGAVLPDSGQIFSGTYRPTNIGGSDLFASPAPGGSYSANLGVFNNTNPNGTWRLFVTDDLGGDSGFIDDGWRLNIQTQTALPSVRLAVSPSSVLENGTANLVYTFTRTGSLSSPLTVNFTRAGTAIDGSDYSDFGNNGNTVTFAAGSSTTRIIVDPRPDTTVESNETVIFTIANGAGYTIGTPSSVTGTILNDDTNRTFTLNNSNLINIPNAGSASPYPSTINVSGVTGTISKLTVSLRNVRHTFPDDIDVLLVGPSGQRTLLMSDVGGTNDLNGVNLTFDSTVGAVLPDSGQIFSGTYRPTNIGGSDLFASPAPGGSYSANLGVFNNTNPNGTWRLFVTDDLGGDFGSIASGWGLTIQT
ncbi:hypothetical protein [Chroococcus sp. FPU101]|uniref:hypothetical protein n=1 Tax=Chroococcus sp. FPU101 TaxID=1974212 RepID=UPI001A8F7C37|nr:hypothetical protein [Chroococcus sp. FPU101]GFE68386.1 hypothetical protein CFPU101_09960 [Chroococcus sp. FPU101]